MATAPRRFFRCACFCSENLYVARYGLHLRFRDEQQLRQDYGPVSGLGGRCRVVSGEASVEEGPSSPGSFALPAARTAPASI